MHTGFLVGKHIGAYTLAVSVSSSRRVHPGAGVRVAKESGFDQQEFGRLDQGEEAFPLRKVNVDAKGLAPASSLSGASLVSVV
jgi:hypothetical protein